MTAEVEDSPVEDRATNAEESPTPSSAAPIGKRPLLFALVAHVALALYLYQDAVFSKGTRVVGATNTEVYPFLWGFHWIHESIFEEFTLPYSTHLMDFPVGGVIWVKEQLTGILLTPIQVLLGIPAAFTTAEIMHSVLAGLGVFMALRILKTDFIAATIAGLTFAYCPHQLGEAYNGNLDAMNIGWSALWIAALLALILRRKKRGVFLAAIALAGLMVSNQYYALAMAFASVPIVFGALLVGKSEGMSAPWMTPLKRLGSALILGFVLALPMLSTLYKSLKATNKLHDFGSPATNSPPFLTEMEHFIYPRHNFDAALPFQDLIYPGFLLLFLAIMAPFLSKIQKKWALLFLALGLFFASLALGPTVYFQGEIIRGASGSPLRLPWHYLIEGTPILEGMSLPHRMAIPSGLFLSLAAGLGLSGLTDRLGRLKGRVLVLFLGVLTLGEIVTYPGYAYPLASIELTKPLYTKHLKQSEITGAVLNLPFNLNSNDQRVLFWHQTLHGRAMPESFRIAQWPSVVKEIPILYKTFQFMTDDGPPIKNTRAPDPEDPHGVHRLQEMGFEYVVFHSQWVGQKGTVKMDTWKAFLQEVFGDGTVFPNGSIVYSLSQDARQAFDATMDGVVDPAKGGR